MIVKARQLKGLDAAYIPGWDCHGLPIENAIEKKYGRNLPRDEMQAKSRAFATEQIGIQMADFKRLGVLGDWDHPYRTMDFVNEAERDPRLQARDRARLRLSRPEARVLVLRLRLLAGRVRDRIRRQEVADAGRGLQGARAGTSSRPPSACRRSAKDAFVVIWTTTAWTIPANQALNLNPELDYALVDTERGLLVLAASLVEQVHGALQARRHGAGHRQGREARRPGVPASAVRRRCRATAACRRCTWPTTPPPKTAPASSTPRRPTAWTTSTPASRTAWPTTTS